MNNQTQTKAGRKIIASLREILDAQKSGAPFRGMKVTIRDAEVIEPSPHDAHSVRATRHKLGVSQPVFAKLVGVSVMLEQSWEQGQRFPGGPARRLLDEIRRHPDYWAGFIRKAS